MCEFLIKAIDARMPTIEEWRDNLAAQFPKALTFLDEHRDVPKSIEDEKRLSEYAAAKRKLNRRGGRGKPLNLSEEEREALRAAVDAYEANPLSEAEIESVKRNFYIELGKNGAPLPDAAYSIATQWKYHDYIVNVDSKKTDEEKWAELEAKDWRGCYKAGDPIECLADGAEWGTKDGPPLAYIVKIPGMTVEEGRRYLEASPDGRRRRFRISPDGVITDKAGA